MSKKSEDDFPASVLELMPHIKDYNVGRVWLPYVMNTLPPGIRTNSLNTDGFGFRYTITGDGSRLSPETGAVGPVSLLTGASLPFGWAATSDEKTVASHLSKIEKLPWYNLALPGLTLPQNIIHLLFFLPQIKEVKRIVLISGTTDLNQFFSAPLYPKLYGGFYQFMEYFSTLNGEFYDAVKREIRIPGEYSKLFSENRDPMNSHSDFLASLTNSIAILSFLAKSLDAELIFALQPVARWIERELSPEERCLILSKPERSLFLAEKTADAYQTWYGSALENICGELNVKYLNLNKHFEAAKDAPAWLFADNFHLVDAGAELVGKILKTECRII
jgi:hypothetical protein